jgi:hypothetical protein
VAATRTPPEKLDGARLEFAIIGVMVVFGATGDVTTASCCLRWLGRRRRDGDTRLQSGLLEPAE